MKSYDWGVFLLILGPVVANIISKHTAAILPFLYIVFRMVCLSISKRK